MFNKIPFINKIKIQPNISIQLNSIIFILIIILIFSHSFFIQKQLKKYLLFNHKKNSLKNINVFSDNIKEFLKHPEKLLYSYVSTIENTNINNNDIEALLLSATLNNDIFEYLSIIDLSGMETLKTESDKHIENIENQSYFKNALSGKEYTSSVMISEDHYPYIIKILPIFKLNKVSKLLYAELNLKGIWDYIDNINTISDDEDSFFIISDNNILCSYQDKKFVFSNESLKTKEIIKKAIQSYLKPTLYKFDDKSEFLIVSKKIESLGYYLVYQKNFSSIMKEIREINFFLIFLSFFIIIIAWFLGHYISKRISLPILSLSSQTKNIGQDNLKLNESYSIRKDEIGILYRAFNDMNNRIIQAKARESLAIIGESAMRISHEIKNPMTAMKNFVHLIITNPHDDEILNEFKEVVPKEIKRIEDLISNLSELSIGKPLNKENFTIISILTDSFKLYEKILTESKIKYSINIKEPETIINADYNALKSVFSNLILNSKESMLNGGTITVSAFLNPLESKSLLILFKDNGSGIKNEVISKIFNPFYTTKCKGLGIGLSVTKNIIDQHNGEIKAESNGVNKGALFTIKIPLK